jgi:hypothetical protein
MTAVLYVPHFIQFFDDSGNPLSGGKLYTYTAGTTTPKATYTTQAGDTENTNPVVLDSQGRAIVFISGSYKFKLTDANDVPVGPNGGITDNVTNFSAFTTSSTGFFQSFSGDAVTTAFTLSDNLGTDEKSLMIFSELEYSTNGTFASDTGWTKGAGWTIAAGVATATGAISTSLEQTAGITIIQGKQYEVRYTVTRSAGSITPSLGGTAGTARSANGTYSETIIAGSTQLISFATSGFTGTLDNVSVRDVGGGTIRNPADYTVNGTALTFNKAPASGTNNIFVFAPYTLINAAGAAQTAADAAQAAQAAAEGAVNAVAYQFTFDSSTSMGDPGTGDFRFNNATLSSVTAIAVDALSSVTGNPDVSDFIATWGASTNTIKGQIKISKSGTPATFAQYNVTAAVTDNTGWLQITVAHVASNGTFSAADVCYLQFTRSGDVGATGPAGSVSATSGVTASTSAGAHLISSGSNDCLQWGAGGGANVTIPAGSLTISGTSSAAGSIFLAEDTDNGTNSVQIIAPASIASNRVQTLPDKDGTFAMTSDVTGGGWVPIKTITASTVATVDFVNGSAGVVLDGTYKAYAIAFSSVVPASTAVAFHVRASTDSGATYLSTNQYDYAYARLLSGGTSGFVDDTAQAQIIIAENWNDGVAARTCGGVFYIFNPADGTYWKNVSFNVSNGNGSSVVIGAHGIGGIRTTSAVNAIRFLASSGNIASGTFTLYGLKDA